MTPIVLAPQTAPPLAKVIGANLKAARARDTLSQAKAAALITARTGIRMTGSTISALENGTRQLKVPELMALAWCYGVPATSILATPEGHVTVGEIVVAL